MNMNNFLNSALPAQYSLRLQGRVSADWSDWLADVTVHYVIKNKVIVTVVTGTVRDQSALFGLLSFVRDLGIPLLAVEAIPQPGDLPSGNPQSPKGEIS